VLTGNKNVSISLFVFVCLFFSSFFSSNFVKISLRKQQSDYLFLHLFSIKFVDKYFFSEKIT
jgi:hypothetical protein